MRLCDGRGGFFLCARFGLWIGVGGFGVIPGGSCLIPGPSLWVSGVWLWIRGVDGGFGCVGVVGLRFWGCGLGVCLGKSEWLSH